nr:10073_t:CDS:2 [Entrophospora candida]
MGGIELLNKLKLLIESIYPRSDDLLRKPIPVTFGNKPIRMYNILKELLETLENCADCDERGEDDDNLMNYLDKSIDALKQLSNTLGKKNENENEKLIQQSYQNLILTDVELNKVLLCNSCKEKLRLLEIITSEKYLLEEKNYKHHLDAFYTSRPLSKLIEQANLKNKSSQQSTISIDYDDSSSKKIQPNTLIEYNLDSDASVFMPMLMNSGGVGIINRDDVNDSSS